jgi:hypothetical protein
MTWPLTFIPIFPLWPVFEAILDFEFAVSLRSILLSVDLDDFVKNAPVCHAGLDPASRTYWNYWIPAFAGITIETCVRLFTNSSPTSRSIPDIIVRGQWVHHNGETGTAQSIHQKTEYPSLLQILLIYDRIYR